MIKPVVDAAGFICRVYLISIVLYLRFKDSANHNKTLIRVARLQEHVVNCRKDNLRKIIHALTYDSQVRTVCMEDVNVKAT